MRLYIPEIQPFPGRVNSFINLLVSLIDYRAVHIPAVDDEQTMNKDVDLCEYQLFPDTKRNLNWANNDGLNLTLRLSSYHEIILQ